MGTVIRDDNSETLGYAIDGRRGKVDVIRKPVTEDQVSDPKTLAKIMSDMRDDIAAARRAADGSWAEFEDIVVGTSGAAVSLAHGMGGRVRWWVVDCNDNGILNGISIKKDPNASTDSVLVLKSYVALTVTIRVEKVIG